MPKANKIITGVNELVAFFYYIQGRIGGWEIRVSM